MKPQEIITTERTVRIWWIRKIVFYVEQALGRDVAVQNIPDLTLSGLESTKFMVLMASQQCPNWIKSEDTSQQYLLVSSELHRAQHLDVEKLSNLCEESTKFMAFSELI